MLANSRSGMTSVRMLTDIQSTTVDDQIAMNRARLDRFK